MSISVIVPSFDSQKTIKRAVDSALCQTRAVQEIIIVDDVSNDGSFDYVSGEYHNNPKVRIVKQAKNGGPSAARNRGIAASQCQWIALLDADDAWEKDRIERISASFKDNDIVADNILSFDAVANDISGHFYEKFIPGSVTLDQFIKKEREGTHFDYGYLKPIIRKEFLSKNGVLYDERVRQGEDYLFYLECLALSARFQLAENPGYIYTTWMGEISRKRSPHTKTSPNGKLLSACVMELVQKYRSLLNDKEIEELNDEAKKLSNAAGAWAFHDAVLRRDYPRIAILLASQPSAREALIDKFRIQKARRS